MKAWNEGLEGRLDAPLDGVNVGITHTFSSLVIFAALL